MIVIVMVKILVKKMPKVMTMMTTDQVAATRMRILQMIHPDWNVKKKQVGSIFQQKSKFIHVRAYKSEKAVSEFGVVSKFKVYIERGYDQDNFQGTWNGVGSVTEIGQVLKIYYS